MRTVRKVEYILRKESDIDENLIYTFGNENDISVLVRKDDMFYWKSLIATNIVWYKKYKTIEQALDGILEIEEYKTKGYSEINEFDSLKDFLEWSLSIIAS